MVFDFKSLAQGSPLSGITDPAQLFDALPNKASGYGYLRAVQKELLDAWSGRRSERDLVIKTNTGGGKTIIGLLLLQCCLHEGKGPALYLVPDKHLAVRVMAEAHNLGLSAADSPSDSSVLAGESICVTTMHHLLNGRSRFGLAGSGRPLLPVKSVIVDDAHAALAMAEQKTQLTIPSCHPAYGDLITLFRADLKAQGANALLDIETGVLSAVQRIPFWAWHDEQDEVLRLLRQYRDDAVFEWIWPLIADLIPFCQAVISATQIEIAPPCPPIEKVPSFSDAERRVYLTATLSDDSVLITHFGANSESVKMPLVPSYASDLGDRLVLAPQELNAAFTHDDVREVANRIADDHNVVVFVPSHKKADEWSTHADRVVSLTAEIAEVVEELQTEHVGLVVVVNRYDGIDLPDDACRLLIIDGLPSAYGAIERREATALRNSEAMLTRQIQRIEQGMGRGVRSRDDRCAVLLVGPHLAQLVARTDMADRFSPATRAQLTLSRRVANSLGGIDVDALQEVVLQVINGDPEFRTASRQALIGVHYGPGNLSPTASPLRTAYEAAARGQFSQASADAGVAMSLALDSGDTRLAGWLGETQASYMHFYDAAGAQAILRTANGRNSAILRPQGDVAYQRVPEPRSQSQQATVYLSQTYASGDDLLLGVQAFLHDLDWDNDRTDAAEDALALLAHHIGFGAQQPERVYGIGSDVLWSMGGNVYAVIEAKTGSESSAIWKKDVNQLAGSVNWCQSEYGDGVSIIPVLVHPTHEVERTGTPPQHAVVVTKAKLKRLKSAIYQFASEAACNEAFKDATRLTEVLAKHCLAQDQIFGTYATAAVRQG